MFPSASVLDTYARVRDFSFEELYPDLVHGYHGVVGPDRVFNDGLRCREGTMPAILQASSMRENLLTHTAIKRRLEASSEMSTATR